MKTETRKYKPLKNQVFSAGKYSIVPIRDKDKYDIMRWRNEQIYHLRQNELLTEEKQEKYFQNVVTGLFEEEKPVQILFSYLKNDQCIGYGGLVHIDWEQKTAELSFIMDTRLEKKEFEKHWLIFIHLIDIVAFHELQFNALYTYAYDLRPHLYPVLEKAGFEQEKILMNEINIHGKPVDVIIHKKKSPEIIFRDARKTDLELLYNWANEDIVRQQSFNTGKITLDEHQKWFGKKLKDPDALIWIAEINHKPVGLVRFDINNNHAVISLSVDKNHRGKGYGTQILASASQKFINLYNIPIYAYIKANNLASVRSFEKAGFIFEKNEIINNIKSVLYIKNKET